MNDTIETVMSFINENTNILIIICVFLIILLAVYLIENSIKSKRIRQNIEEEQMVVSEPKEEEKEEVNVFETKEIKVKDAPNFDELLNSIGNLPDEVEEKEEEPVESSFEENIIPAEDEPKVDVIYKNDKKLSEILFDNIEKQPEGKIDEETIKENDPNRTSADKELDAIMRKLNNMENSVEEDSYTNIF